MSDVRYTLLARPMTLLATVFKGTLAERRVEDTVILDRTVLAAPAPTMIRQRTRLIAEPARTTLSPSHPLGRPHFPNWPPWLSAERRISPRMIVDLCSAPRCHPAISSTVTVSTR